MSLIVTFSIVLLVLAITRQRNSVSNLARVEKSNINHFLG
jgi:hypothetical protein